jgi:hypothetical protein
MGEKGSEYGYCERINNDAGNRLPRRMELIEREECNKYKEKYQRLRNPSWRQSEFHFMSAASLLLASSLDRDSFIRSYGLSLEDTTWAHSRPVDSRRTQPTSSIALTTAHTARTLFAVTDRLIGSIATDFEQFLPRAWPLAAGNIIGELRRG